FFFVSFLVLYSCNQCSNELDNVDNKIIKHGIVKDSILKKQKLEKYFSTFFKDKSFIGCALVSQKGQIIFKNYYGYKNYSKKDTLNIDTRFQLGSVSKQFTAVAILQLFEKNKLKLTDTIQKFFPDFPYHNITIDLLLRHRSGLPNYIYFCDEIDSVKTKPINNFQVIDSLTSRHPQWYYPPDKRFNYSNTGYVILAAIVKKVTGQKFSDYLYKNIFKPLKMNNTFVFDFDKKDNYKNIAIGYLYGKKEAEFDFLDGVVGDKGIYSTVEDLYKWEQGLYTNKIINRKTLKIAFTANGKSKRAHSSYGYGWRYYTLLSNDTIYYHAGWWKGFQAMIIHIEKDTSSIIILKNKKNKLVFDHNDFFKILYPDDNTMRK
ncbi:MAG: serine hydrolase, partial [Bacteroidetes bacterium]